MANIVVNQLTKTIKNKTILKEISFSMDKGECVALIGPNGAGKTTLMDCLIGDKFVSSGTVLINGLQPTDESLKQSVGILPQENVVPTQLKVKEIISFFQSIYKDALTTQEIDTLLQFSETQKNQLAEKLSGGQKRLLSFVIALMGKPEVLFLDEPTAAMDTSTRQRFWEIIEQLKAKGITIFYSSHYIEEVEHTADRILVLHKGELLKDTTPFQMRQQDNEKQFVLPLYKESILQQIDNIYDVQIKHDTVSFMTKKANAVWQQLSQYGISINDIEIFNKTLLNTMFDSTKEEN